jgi:hypothetical protein
LIPYGADEDDTPYNKKVNSLKFIPGSDLIVVGVEDDEFPLKCFNFLTGAEVYKFENTV